MICRESVLIVASTDFIFESLMCKSACFYVCFVNKNIYDLSN